MPSSHMFDSALSNFVVGISKAINGKGVDSFFNPESNNDTSPSAGSIRDFGYFLDLSIASLNPHDPSLVARVDTQCKHYPN